MERNMINEADRYMYEDSPLDDESRLDKAVAEAEMAFWSKIAEQYPEIETGDLDPGNVMDLLEKMKATVKIWIAVNRED